MSGRNVNTRKKILSLLFVGLNNILLHYYFSQKAFLSPQRRKGRKEEDEKMGSCEDEEISSSQLLNLPTPNFILFTPLR
jgi:hypothetical protein